jgi:prepilin peptidase CpaA
MIVQPARGVPADHRRRRRGLAMINVLALLFFPLLMALAATSDLITMKIANPLVLVLATGFVILATVMQMPLEQVALHFLAAGAVLVAGFALFALRWIGGGDAKLMSATALWFGFDLLLPYLVYAALLGGALTLLILALRRLTLPPAVARLEWLGRLHDAKGGIPYGIALAASGLVVFERTDIFQYFAG